MSGITNDAIEGLGEALRFEFLRMLDAENGTCTLSCRLTIERDVPVGLVSGSTLTHGSNHVTTMTIVRGNDDRTDS